MDDNEIERIYKEEHKWCNVEAVLRIFLILLAAAALGIIVYDEIRKRFK